MTETELETMLAPYGTVISTRILRDANMQPRGVGFARMESKEKCESIIHMFNGKLLPSCKEALLVKFADGGNKKKNQFKGQDTRWRDGDVSPAVRTNLLLYWLTIPYKLTPYLTFGSLLLPFCLL